jgi:hypothetical protein
MSQKVIKNNDQISNVNQPNVSEDTLRKMSEFFYENKYSWNFKRNRKS